MASLRQSQIDEILNYERAMNRTILDRTINQVTVFNDERAPPSNRDIKFEAVLGGLVDKLKATMAEALTAITAKQFPTVNAYNSASLLNSDAGEKGQRRIAPPPDDIVNQPREIKKADVEAIARKDAREASAKIELGVNAPTVQQIVPPIQAQPILETSDIVVSAPSSTGKPKKGKKPAITVDTSGKK